MGAQPSKYGSNRWAEDRSYKKDRWGGRRLLQCELKGFDSERTSHPALSPSLIAFLVFSALWPEEEGEPGPAGVGIALGSL